MGWAMRMGMKLLQQTLSDPRVALPALLDRTSSQMQTATGHLANIIHLQRYYNLSDV